ncbi:nucleotidyltransferase family protein [Candidatus Nitrosotenuis uzonensis]|uniref:Nucleotidyl transferase n=1 Tax=Candidatus Nitrosotenuis uzonensis TaxID=1407055 RepID=A0A812F0S2_9ARCH|nr:nucleotidyltransferase family protein [Candidatus Nitrosotenuis uzonensis]CAE6499490.1 Nucleotidyl transferase [Candidatus Nitrosotenuis uzonensis]
MQALILAGGQGSRLKPITDYIPKPLIPINNVPIIEWQIRYLKKFKIENVVICSGYKSEQIQNYLEHKRNFGIKIQHSVEDVPLGTGGALKKAAKIIKDKTFLVLNGDVITTIDITKLYKTPNAIALVELRTRFGTVDFDGMRINNFREKKHVQNVWMNAGIYHLEKNILKDLPRKGAIEDTVFLNYAKKGILSGVSFKDVLWFSIDSHKDLEECSHALAFKSIKK